MAIQGCFLWPQKTVDFLLLEMGQEQLSLSALCTMSSSSSFFSGIGTAELAWQVIGNALRARGVPFHMRNEFVCEKDGDCQSLLLKQPVQHVFSDICGAVPLLVDMDEGATFEHKLNAIMASPICTTVWCLRCSQYCFMGPSQVDTSGSPCQDFSRAGLQLGRNGGRIHLVLIWIRWHMVWETPVIIHENVPQFDLDIIMSMMSNTYHVFAVECSPEDVGFSICRRTRMYVAMLHRNKLRVLFNPEIMFRRLCAVLWVCSTSLDQALLADLDEIRNEEVALATERGIGVRPRHAVIWETTVHSEAGDIEKGFVARAAVPNVVGSGSVARVAGTGSEARVAGYGSMVGIAGLSSLVYLLTEGEQQRLAAYEERWRKTFGTDPSMHAGLVFNLGDNPEAGWLSWSAPSQSRSVFCLPTLRRRWTVQWWPAQKRWITIGERLVSWVSRLIPFLLRPTA